MSSQSLGDLFDAIPCTSKEIPAEILDEAGMFTRYKVPEGEDSLVLGIGAAICIEGVLYAEDKSQIDYAEYVLNVYFPCEISADYQIEGY